MDDDCWATAQELRWGVSRLAQRLRAQQPGREDALTRLAASILANLRHDGPLTLTALATIEGLQPQSLTRTVNVLEADGYLTRSPDEADRRQQVIAITAEGRQALDDHIRDGNAWLAGALERELTPAERALLRVAADLMRQLAEAPGTMSGPARAGAAAPL
ncbi:MarR family winged helix-turn-helix transcriptional regulator [Nocardia mexicana]|uniref:DNA-binding MarR family transcriptional regulator n=1 Tax=Nocardia mexicana TaxID=279262 RepID=A0A370H277_9NOCA|nr:MarR family transcriptional regulator [Nocardia mexicana]RDI50109.1 DNA-binding MarR family transcriptional regulator [Nocardia mexicana]